MTSKSLSELQTHVKQCAEKFNFKWSNYVQYIHLVEEVAELGEALTVQQGDREAGSGESALADHHDLKEELGDVLFNVMQIANQLNLNLDEVMERTFTRYEKKLANLKKRQGV
jgi:NTP pyrophosphatase (non-canonical NTP hydrolase)